MGSRKEKRSIAEPPGSVRLLPTVIPWNPETKRNPYPPMNLRYSLTAALASGALFALAQPTLTTTTSVPTPLSDVAVLTATNYLDIGPAGANVQFHYWDMLTPNTGNRTINYRAASITPTSATIPTATFLSTDGGTDTLFWAVTSQGLEQVGVRTNLEGVINFSDAGLELELPCALGTSWSDAVGASYIVSGIIPVTRVGTITGIADAYGTLDMPQGVQIPEVLRVRVRRDISDNSAVANVRRIANVTYYYSEDLAHPMVTLTQDSVQIGTGAWTVTKSAQWQGNSFIVGVEDVDASEVSFTAYPNPASDVLNVAFAEGASVATRVEVLDAAGRLVLNEAITGGRAALATHGLQAGVYSVRVLAGQQVLGTRRVSVL